MRCRNCPLFDCDTTGEAACWLLPIEDDNCLLIYKNNHEEVIGCYVQKWLIEKIAKERLKELEDKRNDIG